MSKEKINNILSAAEKVIHGTLTPLELSFYNEMLKQYGVETCMKHIKKFDSKPDYMFHTMFNIIWFNAFVYNVEIGVYNIVYSKAFNHQFSNLSLDKRIKESTKLATDAVALFKKETKAI